MNEYLNQNDQKSLTSNQKRPERLLECNGNALVKYFRLLNMSEKTIETPHCPSSLFIHPQGIEE